MAETTRRMLRCTAKHRAVSWFRRLSFRIFTFLADIQDIMCNKSGNQGSAAFIGPQNPVCKIDEGGAVRAMSSGFKKSSCIAVALPPAAMISSTVVYAPVCCSNG
jgi:hypothetical protein